MNWNFLESDILDKTWKDENIVSLTPEASYSLERKGVKYSILEDYYCEEELFGDDEQYFLDQLHWFEEFDAVFSEEVSYCSVNNIDLATAHYYRIKCFVDSVIIYAQILTKFIESTKPNKISYICNNAGNSTDINLYEPFDRQQKIMPGLFKKVCEKYKVDFEVVSVGDPISPKSNKKKLVVNNVKNIAKHMHLKSVLNFFKYEKIRKRKACGKKINILSLHSGCFAVDFLIKNVICNGGAVYLKNANMVEEISSIFQKKSMDLEISVEGKAFLTAEKDLKNVTKVFEEGKLIKWISDKCGSDVSEVVFPYFKDFIETICYENLKEYSLLEQFIEDKHIDFVVTRSSSEKEVISALLAARKNKKRVCFQHSCGAFDGEREHVSELKLFDYYFVMHDEAESHMKDTLKKNYIGECNVYQSAEQIKTVRNRWKDSKRSDNLVMYIPTKLFFGFRSFNGYLYPLTWYYELQKKLVDYFISQEDFQFIFKFAPGQDWSRNSILNYISDRSSLNIIIEKKPVADCLDTVGRVILDYPSTSLYEVAAAQIPVIALHHKMVKIRKDSKDLFGESIKEFSEAEDAIGAIEHFLKSDPEKYKVGMPTSGEESYKVLFDNKTI